MITLTMPDVLCTLLRQPDFLRDLPSSGARVISPSRVFEIWSTADIDVVPHTFGRHLTLIVNLHVLVSDLGLRKSENRFDLCG